MSRTRFVGKEGDRIPYLEACQKLWGKVRANIKWMPRELNERADHHTKKRRDLYTKLP